jgi:pimeloyl-ACP methyl ester carboxylesterase
MIEPLQLPARGLVFDALAAGPPAGDLVADVVAIADRLGAETFHLVGHDWGGVVAWRLAGRHPERVATLTAVSTPHPRAFARALVAGTQALRSAYIPVFRLPRLPELLLGAHRQWGLRRLLAQDGLGADWVDTYARALAQPGGAVGGAGLVPGGHPVQPAGPAGGCSDAVRLGFG